MDIILSIIALYLVLSLLWGLLKVILGITFSIIKVFAFFTFLGILLMLIR